MPDRVLPAARTRCPDCSTVFFVGAEQLAARDGFVRCGRCGALFNATLHFVEPLPVSVVQPPETAEPVSESVAEAMPAGPAGELQAGSQPEPAAEAAVEPPSAAAGERRQVAVADPPPAVVKRRAYPWLWGVAVGLLALVFLLQGLWWFRGDIAARFPLTRAALGPVCAALGCDIPLPRDPDRLRLSASELESDPAKSSLITLRATLSNHARFIQAYPHLELTLTDTAERVLARKVFSPEDYLPANDDPNRGIAAGAETEVRMHLSLDGFSASGYQLELFFP